ncbi:hypothetical protein ASD66_23885 [Nocardioides sp. Root151]|nr:hypothetical protein ASD66_23885 [Nocardioides sp. Root151]
MLPVTVPASQGDAAHPSAGRRVDTALLALDEHLFNPAAAAWLVIDAGNTAVPRVDVPSLDAGLELIGKGRVAALVGHLRDSVGVVDVDVPSEFGNFLAAEIADWLRRRGAWVLERPSGGAKGRWHIFFAHTDYRYSPAAQRTGLAAEVTDFLIGLAADVKVPAHELDLREAVRPLTSPHRHGAVTRPKGNLRHALRDLQRILPERPEPTPLRRRPRATTAVGASSSISTNDNTAVVVPLLFHRWRRELRPDWRRYLLHGHIPAGTWTTGATRSRNADQVDRSLLEISCTRELVWAVGDPQIAWRIIRESHPTVMTKAKHQGEAWWLNNWWNKTVEAADAFRNTTDTGPRGLTNEGPPAEVAAAVAAGRTQLAALAWTVSARQRPALLLVGHHLLDRVLRAGKLRVPCPERDLVLDTGLTDRKTIRAALRLFNGRLGTLHTDCLSPIERDSTSYEFEINIPSQVGGREIPPPVFHTPPPARGLWSTLPRTSHSLWRTLQASPGPTDLTELVVKSGLVEKPEDVPSKSQRSTAKTALAALSHAGLATVDEDGRWSAATRPRSMNVDRRASAAYARQLAIVEEERAAYRVGATSSWTAGRARAIKSELAKQKAWWDNLSPAARAERSSSKRLEFEQMSLTQQSALKARIAERRARAGLDELEHYCAWLRSIPADEFVARSLDRKARFQRLSPAERGASIAAWDQHRRRYGLQTQQPGSSVRPARSAAEERQALLPDGENVRDAAFLERQGALFQGTDHLATG